MHVSLRHLRRALLGAATGALFIAGVSGVSHASDTFLSLCITPHGHVVDVNGSVGCNPPNRFLTWDQQGVTGPQGAQGVPGPTGLVGPKGAKGYTGPAGPQGPVGPTGPVGALGNPGNPGPAGATGATGPQGMQGPAGVMGPMGPTGNPGLTGLNGKNGVQQFFLTGGDLGSNAQTLYQELSLEGNDSTLSNFNSPIYYGPGNGADRILESEAVPIDSSVEVQLWVQVKNVPGAGENYTFDLCKNSSCNTGVECTISLPTLTECSDLIHTLSFSQGDTIALRGSASGGAAATEVSWAVVLQQTAPQSSATPTPVPGP